MLIIINLYNKDWEKNKSQEAKENAFMFIGDMHSHWMDLLAPIEKQKMQEALTKLGFPDDAVLFSNQPKYSFTLMLSNSLVKQILYKVQDFS